MLPGAAVVFSSVASLSKRVCCVHSLILDPPLPPADRLQPAPQLGARAAPGRRIARRGVDADGRDEEM